MSFYRFVDLERLGELRQVLADAASGLGLSGTVLLADEGINGTLAGTEAALETFRTQLCERPAFAGMECRFSAAAPDNPVFDRLKVLIKPEIVALRKPGLDPGRHTGEHVDWSRWNALLDDPDVVVIDTRNAYEIAVGTFPGSADPGTRSFRQWPDYVARTLDPGVHRRVAMFCTGGIRCEKASAYLLQQGFAQVYQLDGGILKYLETVPEGASRWTGECYVFDQRVAVDGDLAEGTFAQCDACGRPVSEADQASADYRPGISCPRCVQVQGKGSDEMGSGSLAG